MRSNVSSPTVTILGTMSGFPFFLLLSVKKAKKPPTSASSAARDGGVEAAAVEASSESIPAWTVCPGVPRYSMKGATTTATRMMRATCWVLTSARRAPTRGARNGLELLLLAFELADDDDDETSFLLTPLSALPTIPVTADTKWSVQSSDASLPARGATAAARGRDQASPAKAAAIVRACSHETSELDCCFFFHFFFV